MFAVSSNGCPESWPTYQLKQCVQFVWRPLVISGRHVATVQRCWRLTFFSPPSPLSCVPQGRKQTKLGTVLICAVISPPADTQLYHGNSKTQSRAAFQRWRRLGGDGERCNDLWQQQNCGGRVFRFSPQCFTVWLVADRTDVTDDEKHAEIRLQLLLLTLKGEKTSLCSVWAHYDYSSSVNLLIVLLISQWIVRK